MLDAKLHMDARLGCHGTKRDQLVLVMGVMLAVYGHEVVVALGDQRLKRVLVEVQGGCSTDNGFSRADALLQRHFCAILISPGAAAIFA